MEEEIKGLEKDMTPVLLEDLGMRFTSDTKKYKARYGLYQCQYCGKEFEVQKHNIKRGNTKSCGCLSKRHGQWRHRLYSIWAVMLQRCCNNKYKDYKYYGARGIKVCDRWLNINNFIEDMYPTYIEGLTLDRIDVNENYESNNCRWTDKDIQQRNTRDIQVNNTSGYRGVSFNKTVNKWGVQIMVENKLIYLGSYHTALDVAKAYETYVRLNNLEHNFTPALREEEIEELNKKKEK